ncbi:MAG: hypothetical protein AB7C97_09225 [Oscillospiraceae bacterium]
MKCIKVPMEPLLKKIQEIAKENMTSVKLSINDEVIDQSEFFPSFLHFEAYAKDGSATDYESIDAISMLISLKPIIKCQNSMACKNSGN